MSYKHQIVRSLGLKYFKKICDGKLTVIESSPNTGILRKITANIVHVAGRGWLCVRAVVKCILHYLFTLLNEKLTLIYFVGIFPKHSRSAMTVRSLAVNEFIIILE